MWTALKINDRGRSVAEDEDRMQILALIRALQEELQSVPYMGADGDWNESASDADTAKYLKMLKSLKREKDADTNTWRKITSWD